MISNRSSGAQVMRMVILLILYVVLPGLHVASYLQGLPFVGGLEAMNYIVSIMVYYAVYNHLLITVRLPFFQSLFPYDKLVRLHALSGVLLGILVYYHAGYKILSGRTLTINTILVLILWTLLAIAAVIWIDTPFTRVVRRWLLNSVRRIQDIPYDLMKRVHGSFFLIFGVLLFFHVRESGLLYSELPFFNAYATWYPLGVFVVVLGSHVRRRVLPRYRVTDMRRVDQTSIVTMEPAGKKTVSYRAGQFGYFRLQGSSLLEEEHPFSFLSIPSQGSLRIGVKVLGDYTERLSRITPGTILRINGGFGNFIPVYENRPVVLIGSGIGIVPLVSILLQLEEVPPVVPVTAFLAVNTRDELLFEEDLKRLERNIPNVTLHLFVYQEDGQYYTPELFRERLEDPTHARYYICSSPKVRDIVLSALTLLGVPASAVEYEAFSY
jgi:predicted ferric reductase